MRKIISKFSKPLQDGRLSPPPSTSRGSIADDKAGEDRDPGTHQDVSFDATEETKSRKLSAVSSLFEGANESKPLMRIPQQERLDGLSNLRISFEAVSLPESASHRGGGKARVVQATVRTPAGDEETVAVKKLNYHNGMDIRKFSNEFVHEVEILATLSHENVVGLIGFAEDLEQGEAWIVLSWQPNGNVSEFLSTGEWEIPERISLIKDTFEGLKYLHNRQPPICHGDLKSLNILVSSSYRAIITDFGSARALDELADEGVADDRSPEGGYSTVETPKIQVEATGNQLTLTGPSWSLRWAPPEVMNGATPSLPSDIWSAGWVCWEIMTNKVPFPELNSEGVITLTVIQGKVPSTREDAQLSQVTKLCSLMTDCWAFDPKDRPGIAQCSNEVAWMPSTPPSSGKAPSPELLLQMGRLHFSHNRQEKAASLFRQALAVAELKGEMKATASALNWLGRSSYAQSKYSEAEEFFIRAQQIFAHIGGDDGRASSLQGLGNLYYSQSKYLEAEESYIQAQQIFHDIGHDQGRANTLRGLGDLYYSQSKYSEAEESYIQAQRIYSSIGDDWGRANTFERLGHPYHAQNKYSEAESSFTQAQQIYTRIGNDQGLANTLRGLGDLYFSQSRYSDAEALLKQSQQICTRIGNDQGLADGLVTLGELYRSQGKFSEAEEHLVQALGIFTRIKDDRGRAQALRDLGNVHRAQGRNVESAAYYTEARDLYARIGRLDDQEDVSDQLVMLSHESNPGLPS